MRYLPDTNIFIAVMTGRNPHVMQRMAEAAGEIFLSAIVHHELSFGAFHSDRISHNLAEIDALSLPLLAFDKDDAHAAGAIRAQLRRAGTPIGPYDGLIAGQALARNLTVVTANMREFERVTGLKVENWLA